MIKQVDPAQRRHEDVVVVHGAGCQLDVTARVDPGDLMRGLRDFLLRTRRLLRDTHRSRFFCWRPAVLLSRGWSCPSLGREGELLSRRFVEQVDSAQRRHQGIGGLSLVRQQFDMPSSANCRLLVDGRALGRGGHRAVWLPRRRRWPAR